MYSDNFIGFLDLAHQISGFSFFWTTFFCLVLILLTTFRVKRKFGSYKKLILISPYFGIFFASLEYLIVPYVHSYNCGFVYFCTQTLFHLNKNVLVLIMETYSGLFGVSIEVIVVQFVYRYWAVFDETKLRFFRGWYILIFVGYSLIFGFVWAFGIFYFMEPDEYSSSYMKEEMMRRYGLDINEIGAKIMVVYDEQGDIRWRSVSTILNMTGIMTTQYIIIIYCAIMMHLKMEERLQGFSASLQNLHRQMFKSLIIQITAPTIVLFLPVFIISYTAPLDLKVSLPTGCLTSLFSIYPGVDAIIIMYVVKDYQRIIKRMVMGLVATLKIDETTEASRKRVVAENSLAIVSTV